MQWKRGTHWPERDIVCSSHKKRPRSDTWCMLLLGVGSCNQSLPMTSSVASFPDHSQVVPRLFQCCSESIPRQFFWPTVHVNCMFPYSDVRNQHAIQRRLAAKRIEKELNDWRREVDAYNRVVSAALLSIDKPLLSSQ